MVYQKSLKNPLILDKKKRLIILLTL